MSENLQHVVFYTIEKTIKSYRQFAQAELKRNGLKITVDQWLTLLTLSENPGISQKELAAIVFKDAASITRIINLLIKGKYLQKTGSKTDGRRSKIVISSQGHLLLRKTAKVVQGYRTKALTGLQNNEISHVNKILNKIIQNCM